MRLALLQSARAIVMAAFVISVAAFVGLCVYAVLQFGLWWPRLAGIDGSDRLLLAAVTMLPFLLLFTKLDWSRPLGWLSARFNAVIEPIDRAIARNDTP
ncbi:MAG: hypothetical protein ACPGQM_09200 [Alphaproteobacteria bacterium]